MKKLDKVHFLLIITFSILIIVSISYLGLKQYKEFRAQEAEKLRIANETQERLSVQQKLLGDAQAEIDELKSISVDEKNKTVQQNKILEKKIEETQSTIIKSNLSELSKTDLNKIIRSTVKILCATDEGTVIGSGSVISTKGYIFTNNHVVEDASLCVALFPQTDYGEFDSGEKGNLIGADIKIEKRYTSNSVGEFAILKINDSYKIQQVFPYRICGNNEAELNDPVMVFGYPPIGGDNIVITEGIISGVYEDSYTTSAKIDQGNSGGTAILKNKKCFVGVPTAAHIGEIESLGLLAKFGWIHTLRPEYFDF